MVLGASFLWFHQTFGRTCIGHFELTSNFREFSVKQFYLCTKDFSRKPMTTQKCLIAVLFIEMDFVNYRRYFDSPNCGGCMYKGSSYCWGQCSLNIWKKEREY